MVCRFEFCCSLFTMAPRSELMCRVLSMQHSRRSVGRTGWSLADMISTERYPVPPHATSTRYVFTTRGRKRIRANILESGKIRRPLPTHPLVGLALSPSSLKFVYRLPTNKDFVKSLRYFEVRRYNQLITPAGPCTETSRG